MGRMVSTRTSAGSSSRAYRTVLWHGALCCQSPLSQRAMSVAVLQEVLWRSVPTACCVRACMCLLHLPLCMVCLRPPQRGAAAYKAATLVLRPYLLIALIPLHNTLMLGALRVEELKGFCTMLGTSGEVQTAWLSQLENAGGEHGVDLRDMLSTASGGKVTSSLEAMRVVGETVAADVYDHLLDRDAQVEGLTVEDVAEDVDLCRFGQELSCAQLFGPAGDFMVERMRKRKCVYNADAMRRKRLTKMRVGDIEVQVRMAANFWSVWCLRYADRGCSMCYVDVGHDMRVKLVSVCTCLRCLTAKHTISVVPTFRYRRKVSTPS